MVSKSTTNEQRIDVTQVDGNKSFEALDSPIVGKIDPATTQDGLAKLVLTLMHVLLTVVERQAYRRVTANDLTNDEVERLGNALMQARSKLLLMCKQFGFEPEELDLDLEKIIKPMRASTNKPALRHPEEQLQHASVIDIIDRIIQKEATISGEIRVAAAGIDLVVLNLFAMLQPVRGASS